ncbi:MAG TPA: metallophosphoesterase [Solirubrobacteraceae bacterium]
MRIAAAGDLHCEPSEREEVAAAFATLEDDVDAFLLAGDLTTHGEPEQAAILADACRNLSTPVVTVLGNHDWHANRVSELTAVLEDAGIVVLDRSHVILELADCELGIAGIKGFIGGFRGSHLPDFGEPLLRTVYAETTAEVQALDAGLRAIAHCARRVALLHYAPVTATIEGERHDIWTFLGCDRFAAPISEHAPDLVLHGHAHAGCFRGAIGGVPVFNVAVPVMGRDFSVFDLPAGSEAPVAAAHQDDHRQDLQAT